MTTQTEVADEGAQLILGLAPNTEEASRGEICLHCTLLIDGNVKYDGRVSQSNGHAVREGLEFTRKAIGSIITANESLKKRWQVCNGKLYRKTASHLSACSAVMMDDLIFLMQAFGISVSPLGAPPPVMAMCRT